MRELGAQMRTPHRGTTLHSFGGSDRVCRHAVLPFVRFEGSIKSSVFAKIRIFDNRTVEIHTAYLQ